MRALEVSIWLTFSTCQVKPVSPFQLEAPGTLRANASLRLLLELTRLSLISLAAESHGSLPPNSPNSPHLPLPSADGSASAEGG